MLTFAAALREKGVPMPEIALKLTIKSGKNAGKPPSVASLYRALADAAEGDAQAGEALSLRPAPARITGPGSGTDPELMERLQRQGRPLPANSAGGRFLTTPHQPIAAFRRTAPHQEQEPPPPAICPTCDRYVPNSIDATALLCGSP
jgi:hypothetical protein